MLILKGLQRYLERFEVRSSELYPLSEERKRTRDSAAAKICKWILNLVKLRQLDITVLWAVLFFFSFFFMLSSFCSSALLIISPGLESVRISLSTACANCQGWSLCWVVTIRASCVVASYWHVIIMASADTLGFLESLGTWLFSLDQ